MRIGMRHIPISKGEVPVAEATLTILTDLRPVELKGIVVRQPRPGWITLEVPPLERWAEPMRWLTPPQRERVESAEFYQLLQDQITRRFLSQEALKG